MLPFRFSVFYQISHGLGGAFSKSHREGWPDGAAYMAFSIRAVEPGVENCHGHVPIGERSLLIWRPWERNAPAGQFFPSRCREEEP